MTVPTVSISKRDGQTGSVGPSNAGVLAILAGAGTGTQNAMMWTRDDLSWAQYGPSKLANFLSYQIGVSGQPSVGVRSATSTAASYGAITSAMVGTSVPSAGAAVPNDDYDVVIAFLNDGTISTPGIMWTYALDAGQASAPRALGSLTTITIPNFSAGGSPGVSFNMAAGTVKAGDHFSCLVKAAKVTNADIPAALEALRVSSLPWEGVLVDSEVASGTVALVDTWLTALEKVGKFRFGLLNTRLKNQPGVGDGTSETESDYTTAVAAIVAVSSPTIRGCLGTDGGDITSSITGLTQPRPTSLFLGARAMAVPIGQEPAYVATGPLGGVVIDDQDGNPVFHDEDRYPNLSGMLLVCLRSIPGEPGVYINQSLVFSSVTSDYRLLPHIRTMNAGCEAAFATLTKQLNIGVQKSPPDPKTGAVFMLAADRLGIEGLVNTAVRARLKGQVSGALFTLATDDDLSSNGPQTVNGWLKVSSKIYVAGFNVIATFVKSISVSL